MTQRKIFLFSKHDFHLRFASIRKFRFKIINHDFKRKKIIGSCLVVKTTFRRPCFLHSNVFCFVKLYLSHICISATGSATISTTCTMSSTTCWVNIFSNELGNQKQLLFNDRVKCARWCCCIKKNDVLRFIFTLNQKGMWSCHIER